MSIDAFRKLTLMTSTNTWFCAGRRCSWKTISHGWTWKFTPKWILQWQRYPTKSIHVSSFFIDGVVSDSCCLCVAGVWVGSRELCVPVVQVRRTIWNLKCLIALGKLFHTADSRNSLLWFLGTSQMMKRVWMKWGWPFASSHQCSSAALRRWRVNTRLSAQSRSYRRSF